MLYTARVTVVLSCPVGVCACLSVRSFLPPRSCRSQNIGTNGFTTMQKNSVFFC